MNRIIGQHNFKKILSLLLVAAIMLSTTACSSKSETSASTGLSDPNEEVLTENIEEENTIVEDTLTEHITSEIYLNEIILAEDKISELLLEEDTIDEVLLCKTYYIPEESIDEFSENSQTAQLFGEGVDISSLLKKVAVGTGVIVTLVVLKEVGLPEPIASIVVGAADKSLKFAEGGAVVGSLFGGMTGAADELDESGRTSAVIGFATAAAGLVLATVSLLVEIPTGGASSVTLATGIRMAIAGVSIGTAAAGTVYAGKKAIKTFSETDATDIDWNSIDWSKVGVSAAEKAVQNSADGYMWGSIYGAVYGGAEGYEFYHKFNTPYTSKILRLNKVPKKGGKWTGDPGESEFILDEPITLKNGAKITSVNYRNGVPDFSPYAVAEVKISNMTDKRLGTGGNYEQANTALAKYWSKVKFQGKKWTAREVETYRKSNNLTWHEMSNMEYMQLVPTELNSTFTHYGGVAEYNAMIGQEGVTDFD